MEKAFKEFQDWFNSIIGIVDCVKIDDLLGVNQYLEILTKKTKDVEKFIVYEYDLPLIEELREKIVKILYLFITPEYKTLHKLYVILDKIVIDCNWFVNLISTLSKGQLSDEQFDVEINLEILKEYIQKYYFINELLPLYVSIINNSSFPDKAIPFLRILSQVIHEQSTNPFWWIDELFLCNKDKVRMLDTLIDIKIQETTREIQDEIAKNFYIEAIEDVFYELTDIEIEEFYFLPDILERIINEKDSDKNNTPKEKKESAVANVTIPAVTTKKKTTKFQHVDVLQEGVKLVLPEGMSLDEAVIHIKRLKEQEETEVAVSCQINAFPMDGAVALMRVLQREYGWSNMVPTPGFWGSEPPKMIDVEYAPGKTVQVAWGSFRIPGIDGRLECSYSIKENRYIFCIAGQVKRRSEKEVHRLASLVRKEVEENSIYRGKAIRLDFRKNKQGIFELEPIFLKTDGIDEEQLIFSREVQTRIEVDLFNVIEHTESCRKFGIPRKRGILLEGPYGTGKTLTAYVCSKKCVDNGWTYIYLGNVSDLDNALNFARLYQPCVIFSEDIDQAIGEDRDEDTNNILNTLDGVNSKDCELVVVLTTNNVEKLNHAFLRPGRIDSVISIALPDEDATMRLIRRYSRDPQNPNESFLEATDQEIIEASRGIVGKNAATVRETVERSKLSAVKHSRSRLKITADDIKTAVASMENHIKLLLPKNNTPTPASEALVDDLVQKVSDSIAKML